MIAGTLLFQSLAQAKEPRPLALVPQPLRISVDSEKFTVNADTTILVDKDSPDAANVGNQLAERLSRGTGLRLRVSPTEVAKASGNTIFLTTKNVNAELGPEGYTLQVAPEGVTISASAGPGLFYGMQTLLQLLPPQVFGSDKTKASEAVSIPAVRIEDRPRFRWRGLMLDVSRHFFSKDEVKNFIDLLAQQKMNVFHWHLVDGRGWRIEIKHYPKLTQVGAWRKDIGYGFDPKDGTAWGADERYGGFYTQDDVRDIVAYAKQRYVTIVPEIEMPGHSAAALAAYPEYSCTGGPNGIEGDGGPFVNEYCAGNDGTFKFLENILSEVMDLFPSECIHIGGDEVDKTRWKNCPKCQARMRANGLKNENELQSYFIRRIEKLINANGRTLIGWDEILEGGLAPNATVMSWRGIQGGITAAEAGHNVVMTPVDYCYFDYHQAKTGEPNAVGAFLPLQKVYAFEPVPAGLNADKAKHVLGADGNLWTEMVPNYSRAQYMTYPRACAMAEVTWSDPTRKNWNDFCERLGTHFQRLEAQGVNFRRPKPADSTPSPQP
jgi:hexosaminidase